MFGEVTVDTVIEGEIEGDSMTGTTTAKGPWGEIVRPFEATRDPESSLEEEQL